MEGSSEPWTAADLAAAEVDRRGRSPMSCCSSGRFKCLFCKTNSIRCGPRFTSSEQPCADRRRLMGAPGSTNDAFRYDCAVARSAFWAHQELISRNCSASPSKFAAVWRYLVTHRQTWRGEVHLVQEGRRKPNPCWYGRTRSMPRPNACGDLCCCSPTTRNKRPPPWPATVPRKD